MQTICDLDGVPIPSLPRLKNWEATDWVIRSRLRKERLLYWHPRSRNMILDLDLNSWEQPFRAVPLSGDLVFAQKGNECLFWHLGLGVGVRSNLQLPEEDCVSVWYSNGAFFFATTIGFNLYIVPLHPHSYAAVAQNRSYSAPQEAPFVPARLVSSGITVRLGTGTMCPLTPAMFVVGIKQLYLLEENESQ